MEDTLRELNSDGETSVNNGVLILVLMEDTLRVAGSFVNTTGDYVLILVLMEDTLRVEVAIKLIQLS